MPSVIKLLQVELMALIEYASRNHNKVSVDMEMLRSATHTLYAYCLLEDPSEQMKKYTQAREQMVDAKRHIDQFQQTIKNLKSNNQP